MRRLKSAYPWNILVFPAASEIGLEIHRALRDCKEVRLFAANLPGLSQADFHYRQVLSLPPLADPDFLAKLQQLVTAHKIDAIYPAHDEVLEAFALWGDRVPVPVITASPATCRLCRSKRATYQAMAGIVPVPQHWAQASADLPFPIFVKPDKGQGSQRARPIADYVSLTMAMAEETDLLLMENLSGAEYTVDCFSTVSDGVLFAAARRRVQAKTGIAVLTETVLLPEAADYAARIQRVLGMQGAWFFQMKADAQGQLKLLEIAPRIAGSMALSRALGPNLPLLSLYAAAGHKVQIDAFAGEVRLGRSLDTHFIDHRPFDALYIDLDDTLVVHDTVNSRLVALIYNCHNRGIPVHLITRHQGDLLAYLNRFRLAHLFTRIIHIADPDEPKAIYITEANAVLVDDSFRERHTALELRGTRGYDAAGALCLMDERV